VKTDNNSRIGGHDKRNKKQVEHRKEMSDLIKNKKIRYPILKKD
tara:strand:- start:127 stop:258 length:132 start_codon:yes stop_codon:yes gene_type:complete